MYNGCQNTYCTKCRAILCIVYLSFHRLLCATFSSTRFVLRFPCFWRRVSIIDFFWPRMNGHVTTACAHEGNFIQKYHHCADLEHGKRCASSTISSRKQKPASSQTMLSYPHPMFLLAYIWRLLCTQVRILASRHRLQMFKAWQARLTRQASGIRFCGRHSAQVRISATDGSLQVPHILRTGRSNCALLLDSTGLCRCICCILRAPLD